MILVDANILVYAFAADMPEHPVAEEWLTARLRGRDRVGLPWESLTAFVRLVTNPRVFPRPASLRQAWDQVERWRGCRVVWHPGPSADHADLLADALDTAGLRSADVADAHLAAIALGHGLRLISHDHGFARFRGLRWADPLSPGTT